MIIMIIMIIIDSKFSIIGTIIAKELLESK